MTTPYSHLTQLGQATEAPATPEAAVLETVPNPTPGPNYLVRFTCPEFTSLCPMTGQPDFAHIVIDYMPDARLVESKSLKLYLASFRNHGAFHEGCTMAIAQRLVTLLEPVWLRIGAYWYPRGGIPIDVFWATGRAAGRKLDSGTGRAALSGPRVCRFFFFCRKRSKKTFIIFCAWDPASAGKADEVARTVAIPRLGRSVGRQVQEIVVDGAHRRLPVAWPRTGGAGRPAGPPGLPADRRLIPHIV